MLADFADVSCVGQSPSLRLGAGMMIAVTEPRLKTPFMDISDRTGAVTGKVERIALFTGHTTDPAFFFNLDLGGGIAIIIGTSRGEL